MIGVAACTTSSSCTQVRLPGCNIVHLIHTQPDFFLEADTADLLGQISMNHAHIREHTSTGITAAMINDHPSLLFEDSEYLLAHIKSCDSINAHIAPLHRMKQIQIHVSAIARRKPQMPCWDA